VQPVLDQPAGDRIEPRHPERIAVVVRQQPVAFASAGVLQLAVIDGDLGGQRPGMKAEHDILAGKGQGCDER
jgi:hypothetical protein